MNTLRELATLKVMVDTSPGSEGQSSDFKSIGPDAYQITLRRSKLTETQTQAQTVLAHELGHFIATITRDQTHHPLANFMFQLSRDTSSIIPGERKAWELAKKMDVSLDAGIEQVSMLSYTKHPSQTGGVVTPEFKEIMDMLEPTQSNN